MITVMRDYLTPHMFSNWAYVWSILHFFCATIFSSIALDLKKEGSEKFICHLSRQVDDLCFSRYQQSYDSPVPFHIFMIFSIWFPLGTALIYSLAVQKRVKEVESRNRRENEGIGEDQARIRGTFYVFYFYFSHLIIRFLSGILFTLLQHAVFFPNGFESEFRCNISQAMFTSKNATNISVSHLNSTIVACENVTASHKQLCWTVLSALNLGFTLAILFEIYRLLTTGWRSDTEFIIVFLYGRQYIYPNVDPTIVDDCIEYYKGQISRPSRPKPTPEDLTVYVHPIIQINQVKLRFSKNMERQDIFNVFMKVPPDSVCLEDVKDLFHPGQDTKGNVPLRILAVGRPGIGKTVLTDKIMRDWASRINEVYYGKIAIVFKLKWFNSNEMKHVDLKTFLRYGTGLSNEKFEKIYEDLIENPEKAFLIFDGLDESNCNVGCLDELQPPDDPNVCMSATSLFIKLISGQFLQGATVLVTSRPTAIEFYSRFTFDRTVEITGFTSVKIEEYVRKFCEDHNKSDLHPKVWNHIKSSSDLLHLCYIPVNCYIVTSILFECVSDPGNDSGAIPTTLTELYLAAITHFDKHHSKMDTACYEKAMKKLQLLAFRGINDGRLVFDNELFDKQMKNSGLLHKLSNPYSLVQIQYCFIHLTIQEFLAARHVTEKFTSEEIQKFIASHIHSGKWHLVLQFVAGLLRKKVSVHSETCYTDCVMAFAGSVVVMNGELSFRHYRSRFVLKCLREFGDEIIVRKVCAPETTGYEEDINHEATIQQGSSLSLSRLASCNWAAATRVLIYKASQRPKL